MTGSQFCSWVRRFPAAGLSMALSLGLLSQPAADAAGPARDQFGGGSPVSARNRPFSPCMHSQVDLLSDVHWVVSNLL